MSPWHGSTQKQLIENPPMAFNLRTTARSGPVLYRTPLRAGYVNVKMITVVTRARLSPGYVPRAIESSHRGAGARSCGHSTRVHEYLFLHLLTCQIYRFLSCLCSIAYVMVIPSWIVW